jgi:hypothetical protein
MLLNVTLARSSEHSNIGPGSAERAERLSVYQAGLRFIAFLSRFRYPSQTCLGEALSNQKSYADVPKIPVAFMPFLKLAATGVAQGALVLGAVTSHSRSE